MTAEVLRVRRATLDDLDALRSLWDSMQRPVAELEPRLTEFQVVEDAEGKVAGIIGFQAGAGHGRLHNEGFADFEIAAAGREAFWKRIQTLATNHGILRLWMLEDTPFWRQIGFKPASAEELKKLPEGWKKDNASWFTLQLKDEAAINAIEKEMAMLLNSQKRHNEEITQRVQTAKKMATLIATVLAFCIFAAAVYLMLKRPEMLHFVR